MSTDAVVIAALRLKGLSWGDPATRREYARLLAPWDAEPVAVALAGEQSSCALTVMAALLIAEVDGTVERMGTRRGRVDPLRVPRAGHYDSLPYLEQLAIERGARVAVGRDAPDLRPGVWFGNGEGGGAHVGLVVEGPDPDGWITTVEGGQVDPLNPKPSPKNCTRIAIKRQRLAGSPGRWLLGGKVLRYTCDAGALPCVQTGERKGMPWELIGVKP